MRGSQQTTVCFAHDKAEDDNVDDDDDDDDVASPRARNWQWYERQATPRSDKKTLVPHTYNQILFLLCPDN